ncbi:MAG: SET domain-containing protein-lysine N-methyltransferase [Alphaproteobacteria bacterium]|nr:SET domain-containing protein-lysine N-methyltransferase [Alphaproteobacteria bacterium]
MMLVRTHVSRSSIHGCGLFAAERIAKGTVVWRFEPLFDIVIPLHHVDTLPEAAKAFLKIYAYPSPLVGGNLMLDADNGKFMNHSPEPNTENSSWVSIATRDIADGEELTCDYGEFYEDFLLHP